MKSITGVDRTGVGRCERRRREPQAGAILYSLVDDANNSTHTLLTALCPGLPG